MVSGAHPAYYSICSQSYFCSVKAEGVVSRPLSSIKCPAYLLELYVYSPLHFHIMDRVSITFTFSEMLNVLHIKGNTQNFSIQNALWTALYRLIKKSTPICTAAESITNKALIAYGKFYNSVP